MIWGKEIEKKLEDPKTRFEAVCELVKSSQDGVQKAIDALEESAGLLYAIEVMIAGKAHADRTRTGIENAVIRRLHHHTEEIMTQYRAWEAEEAAADDRAWTGGGVR